MGIQNMTLRTLQRDCSPVASTAPGCWEHRCSQVMSVTFPEATLLPEFDTSAKIGPYKLRFAPMASKESNLAIPPGGHVSLRRERVHAVAVRWWSSDTVFLDPELFCGPGRPCGTLLWGN